MRRKSPLGFDWNLLIPVLLLSTLSLTTLFSINLTLFKSQLIFFFVAIVAFLFFSQVNYLFLKNHSVAIYIISLVLLILVLLLGLESRGSVRWLEIFGIRIQFSEILKPFLALSLASFLARHNNYSFKTLLSVILFLSPVVILIFLQPDLGNALIYAITAILSLVAFGFPWRFFFLGIIMLTMISPLIWKLMHAYQKERLFAFFHPTDPLGISYNAIQSIIAIGSGMLFGKGLGQGTQSGLRFLPEQHTDFIFATISEELGFVGSTILILLFLYFLYRIFNVFLNAQEPFTKIFTIISFCLVSLQFFINVGMNLGILPIVGVTLPFVSYGGSSLLSSFILLGLLSSINQKDKRDDVLEIR